jgi:hypothetical protein
MVGFDKPVAVSIVVGATNFLFGFANFAALDRFGRRVVLLITLLGMVDTRPQETLTHTNHCVSRLVPLQLQRLCSTGYPLIMI